MVDQLPSEEKRANGENKDRNRESQLIVDAADPNQQECDEDQDQGQQALAVFKKAAEFMAGHMSFLKSSSFWTALATIVIAWSTIVYTHYSKKQWAIMRHTLAIDERPWFRITLGGEPQLVDGQQLTVPIVFLNGGKTSAKEVEGYLFIYLVNNGQPLDFSEKPYSGRAGHHVTIPLVPPTPNGTGTRIFRALSPEPVIVTPELRQKLNTGQQMVFLHGVFHYSDALGTPHWFRFCGLWPSGSVSPEQATRCTQYTNEDSNEPN